MTAAVGFPALRLIRYASASGRSGIEPVIRRKLKSLHLAPNPIVRAHDNLSLTASTDSQSTLKGGNPASTKGRTMKQVISAVIAGCLPRSRSTPRRAARRHLQHAVGRCAKGGKPPDNQETEEAKKSASQLPRHRPHK